MKIKFDGNQAYQYEAIDSVLSLFAGQPLNDDALQFSLSGTGPWTKSSLGEIPNRLVVDSETILGNIQRVQARHSLPRTSTLDSLDFSVEMETGTGKTYVYLRTIFELHREFGFSKFIVVVPSVAIREGVMTNLRLMTEHFQSLFGNVAFDTWIYDSRQYSKLRYFAQSNTLQILVMNIDAFNKKDVAVIHQEKDQLSGRRPIDFVRATRPIVIMDEPQNMETTTAKEAIASLNPLCTLRYSATHRNVYNLVYELSPVKAYDMKLVKRIEVSSVLDEPDFNQPFIQLSSVSATKSKITAKIVIDVNDSSGPQRKSMSISGSDVDLFKKSNERANYSGYIIDEINAAEGFVSFTNGVVLYVGQSHGGKSDEVMRVQIREAVREHFDKELRIKQLLPRIAGPDARMKVLTLFFIDRVANYVAEDGKIRHWFLESYRELAPLSKYQALNLLAAEKVHNGYFAAYKGIPKDTRGDTSADDDAYALIMRDKERLLSPDEPLRFIFSHSALREGWDNPNVFQICTLNETKSEIKKRQEIGRGLRLPVLESGERCFDPALNRLTIIANEHYDEFAKKLQTEIETECGVSFEGRIINKRATRSAKLVNGWSLNNDFKELWNRIKHRTRYAVEFSTPELIDRASRNLAGRPSITAAKISIEKSSVQLESDGLNTKLLSVRENEEPQVKSSVPDLLGHLQARTELTRKTIAQILIGSGRLAEVPVNPHQFLEQAEQAIRAELQKLMIDGIKYEKIAGQEYEMLLFEEREITGALSQMIDVENSIYDAIAFDSEIEREFAQAMSTREDIRLFIKLPPWFKIPTPLGTYNPDWAIVKEEDSKVYLVRETKSTTEQLLLRSSEWGKIQCGKAHFDTLGVDFAPITSAKQV